MMHEQVVVAENTVAAEQTLGTIFQPKPQVEEHTIPMQKGGRRPYKQVPNEDALLLSVLKVGAENAQASASLRKALAEKTGDKYTHATALYLKLAAKYPEQVCTYKDAKNANLFYLKAVPAAE